MVLMKDIFAHFFYLLVGATHFFPMHVEGQHLFVVPQSASVRHSSLQIPKRPGLEYLGHDPGLTP